MLLILGSWLLLALTTTLLGWTGWQWLARRYPAAPPLPAEVLSLSGVALLIMILAPLSLVMPIGVAAQALVGGGVLLLLLGQRRALGRELGHWRGSPGRGGAAWWAGAALLPLLLLALLLYQQAGSHNPDAQLYYLPTLHWLAAYPVVPGLGNLHGRLAFNSQLFLVTALFRVATPTGTYYPLPPYLGTLLAVAAVRGVVRGLRGGAGGTAWPGAALLLFFAYFYLCLGWLASAAPDCALGVFLSFIFLLYSGFFGPCEVQGQAGRPRLLVLVLLSCVAVTIKLSALPVLLLPLHALWAAHKQAGLPTAPARPAWLGSLGLGVLLFGPWVVRNLLLSGYPVYPLPGLPGLPVDWRIPPALVLTEQRLVVNMARDMPKADWYGPVATSWQQWLPRWWQQEWAYSPATTALLVLAAVAPLVAWRQSRRTAAHLRQPGWFSAWLVAAAGGLFWFALAPDYRFGMGFLLVLAFWPWLTLPLPRWLGALALAVIVAGTLQLLRDPVYGLRHPLPGAASAWWWPRLPPLPPTVPQYLPDGQLVHIAQDQGACGETPLPCTFQVQPGLERRGQTLGAGFRIRPAAPRPR